MTKTIEKLNKTIEDKDSKILDLTRRNEEQRRRIKMLEKKVFGSSSEQAVINEDNPDQPFLDFKDGQVVPLPDLQNPKEEKKSDQKTKAKKKKGGGNQMLFPENIDTEELFLDVPENERTDPETGKTFPVIAEERTTKLIRVAATWKKLVLIRPVYGCGNLGVVKAELPQFAVSTKLDETAIADILVKRFCHHLPFYRIEEIYKEENFKVTRQTLDKIFLDAGATLCVLAPVLKEEIFRSLAIHIDETTVKQQKKGKGSLHQAFMWLVCGTPPDCIASLVWMHFDETRKHHVATDILGDYSGIVHSDAYQAYENLASLGKFTWAMCWVHARRKFLEATECTTQKNIIGLMTNIMHEDNKTDEMNSENRLKYRQTVITPLVDQLLKYMKDNVNNKEVMAFESLSKAFNYVLKRQESFKAFLQNSEAQMDNNKAERAIRPFTIGRKNWLFVGSQKGGEASALMYSLLQSCRNFGINPQEYLENVLRRLPYTSKEDLVNLLPHKWKKIENPLSPYLPTGYQP